MRGIEKLPGYTKIIKDWKITNTRYEQLLSDEKSVFTYLDPPMKSDLIYMESGGICTAGSTTTILLSSVIGLLVLNLYLIIRLNSFCERFKDYQTGEFDLTYTMRSVGEYMREQKERKELVLFNYGIEGLVE